MTTQLFFSKITSKPLWGTKDFHGPFSTSYKILYCFNGTVYYRFVFYKINYEVSSCSILYTSGFNILAALACLWMMQWVNLSLVTSRWNPSPRSSCFSRGNTTWFFSQNIFMKIMNESHLAVAHQKQALGAFHWWSRNEYIQ